MTEQNTTAPTGKEFEPIASQEALDKIISDRLARERAKYQDYDQLKTEAAELAKIRDAQKTDQQKSADAFAALEKRVKDAEDRAVTADLAASRAQIAAAKGVPAELLSGTTTDEINASADQLIKFKGQTGPLVVPKEGNQAVTTATPAAQFGEFLNQQLNT